MAESHNAEHGGQAIRLDENCRRHPGERRAILSSYLWVRTLAGLGNVDTRVLDARSLDLEPASFDAVVSRLALMLISERKRRWPVSTGS